MTTKIQETDTSEVKVKQPYEDTRMMDDFIITKAFERGASYSTDPGSVFGMLTVLLQNVRVHSRSIADGVDNDLYLMQTTNFSGEEDGFNLDDMSNADNDTPSITSTEYQIKRDNQGKI